MCSVVHDGLLTKVGGFFLPAQCVYITPASTYLASSELSISDTVIVVVLYLRFPSLANAATVPESPF